MTGEHQNQHRWTEKRAARSGSGRDEAWLVHTICRVVAQELEEPIRAIHERLDALEEALDRRMILQQKFTEVADR